MNGPYVTYVRVGNKKPRYIGVFMTYQGAVVGAAKVAPPSFVPTQPPR